MIKKRITEDPGYYSATDELNARRMTSEEERDLFVAYRERGDQEARDTLVKNQLLFVAKEAMRIAPDWMPLSDVISAANMALMTAVQRFNYNRGSRFFSYIRKYVLSEIMSAMRGLAPVHIPNGRRFPQPATWEDQEQIPENALSAEAHYKRPDDEAAKTDYWDRARSILLESLRNGALTPLESHVVWKYFFENWTLQRIADNMPAALGKKGLTRERIRQISKKACTKLRRQLERCGITSIECEY